MVIHEFKRLAVKISKKKKFWIFPYCFICKKIKIVVNLLIPALNLDFETVTLSSFVLNSVLVVFYRVIEMYTHSYAFNTITQYGVWQNVRNNLNRLYLIIDFNNNSN